MMKKHIIIGVISLAALLPVACNKSSSTTTSKPSLDGLSMNQAPAYVAQNTVLTFKAQVGSIYASDGTSPVVGLCWQVGTGQKDTLTLDITKSNPEYTCKTDTLGSYTVFCYAFAGSDYYATSVSSSFRAVDPDNVLTGVAAAEEITVNGKTWKTMNQSHATMGQSFRNSPIMDGVIGRMFSWEEAQTVCPDGWHLPTVAEFEASFADENGVINAADLMADASFLDQKMWEYFPQMPITNKYGFNALPLGYIDNLDSFYTYEKYGEYAMWWTADEYEGAGTYLYIYQEYPEVRKYHGDKNSLAMAVRCVKD